MNKLELMKSYNPRKLRILSLRAVLRRAVMCVGLLAPGYAFSGGATLNDYGSGISYQPTLAAPPGKVWAYEHATGQNILIDGLEAGNAHFVWPEEQ